MSSIIQIQDRLNDCAGQLAVLDLALSSPYIQDAIEETQRDGLSALVADVQNTLEDLANQLDDFKPSYSPEEKEKFKKASTLISQIQAGINPQVAVN